MKINGRLKIVSMGMLAPRKFMQKRRKVEEFIDAEDEVYQKNWRKMMNEIEETGSAVSVLRSERVKNQPLPREMVLGTLKRFKQLKKWNIVSEVKIICCDFISKFQHIEQRCLLVIFFIVLVKILDWLRTQTWWDFSEMDFLMLVTAFGKLGDFNRAERVLSYMNKKGYVPNVISQTALMEAYGKGRQYSKAEATFRRMQSSGPEPSAITYQIILKIFVEVIHLHQRDFFRIIELPSLPF